MTTANKTIKNTFDVLKLNCASCAINVESFIKNQSGVVNASVNYATSKLTIEYYSNILDAEKIKALVQSIGYDLLINDQQNKAESLEEINFRKLKNIKNNALWAMIFAVPIMLISMVFYKTPYANEIMWVLSTPVVLFFAKDFFINAWKQAKHRSTNMDTLVALSISVAYLFSVFNVLFPQFWESKGFNANVYFEAAVVITAFILLGRYLEEKAKHNTSSSIRKLMGLQPKYATIITDIGIHQQIPIEEIKIDNVLLTKPGEKIAVDGIVIEGNSYVDESMLSGEPLPINKTTNTEVYAGTINQKGSFKYKAKKVGNETMLAQIIKMVQEAQGSKASVQKLVDKAAAVFVPVVIIIAFLSFIIWNILGTENEFTHGLLALITVLIIACPCALGLATPTAIMVGIGKGAEKGILIKDADSLEQTKKINAVVLDKTGTITYGKPQVTDEYWISDNNELKSFLLSIEKHSEHPLAEAIVNNYKEEAIIDIVNFESITGKGVKAVINDIPYFIGNKKLIEENNIPIDEQILEKAYKWSNEAKSIIWFANNKEILALIAIADKIKDSSKLAIEKLQNENIDVYMLTGDNELTAKAVAEQIGIKKFYANMLPDNKALFVKQLQNEGKIVAMIGDGINDSAALAQANVSIAMGKGSDIAMDVAKMTIISDNLDKINEAIKLSKNTVATIKQNLFWAFIYNIIAIPIAAGVLYPVNGFLLNPMIAGAAMAMSSVSVVSNSLRLKFKK